MRLKNIQFHIRRYFTLLSILFLLAFAAVGASCGKENPKSEHEEEEIIEESVEYEPAEEEETLTEEAEPVFPELTPVIPTPTPTPLFDIINGETIWLSITREQLKEYAIILRDGLQLNDAALGFFPIFRQSPGLIQLRWVMQVRLLESVSGRERG